MRDRRRFDSAVSHRMAHGLDNPQGRTCNLPCQEKALESLPRCSIPDRMCANQQPRRQTGAVFIWPPEHNLVRGACDQTRLVRFQGRHHDAAPRRSNSLTHGLRNRLGLACRMGVPPSPRESPAHHRRPRNPQWVQGYPTGCASITLHRNVRGFFMQP